MWSTCHLVVPKCVYTEEKPGFLCDEHAAEHPRKDYGGVWLKVVNSPRMGACTCAVILPAELPYQTQKSRDEAGFLSSK